MFSRFINTSAQINRHISSTSTRYMHLNTSSLNNIKKDNYMPLVIKWGMWSSITLGLVNILPIFGMYNKESSPTREEKIEFLEQKAHTDDKKYHSYVYA